MPGGNEWAGLGILAGSALKSMAVLGAAGLTALLLRRRSAAARHVVWTAAFASLLALPFFALWLPAVRISVSPALVAPGVALWTAAPISHAAEVSHAAGSEARAASSEPRGGWRVDWRLTLLLVWGAGALAVFLPIPAAWSALWRARREAGRLVPAEAAALAAALEIRGEVEVLESRRGSMPMTFGLLRPAIFLPADAAEWSQERRRMVLLHELAHVRRGDVPKHLMARTALSLYWWNPLAWVAWREFLKERERATDDLVLGAGAEAPEYAGLLLEIARGMQTAEGTGWAAVAMARPSQLEGRLRAILDASANRQAPARASAWVAQLVAVLVAAPLAALQAQESPPADVDATVRAARAQRNPEILDNAAKAAAGTLQYGLARKLLESALANRAEVWGFESVEYGVGLVKLGQLERKRGNLADAEAFYAKAVSVLGERPEALPALIDLGVIALVKKQAERAIEFLQSARRADPGHASRAMMWIAVLRERGDDIEGADAGYKEALGMDDPNSPEAATLMEVYAQFLRRHSREDEANSMRDRAMALRKALVSPPPAVGADVHRVGGGVTLPVLVSKVEPEYTEEARLARYEGTAVVQVEIRPDGAAHSIRVVRGVGLGLNEKAIEAISQWRFKPGTKDGQPVSVAANIEVNWRLL